MATIQYKCDTCKRTVEIIENLSGITSFSNCIITNKCSGKMYQLKKNPDNIREQQPAIVAGVPDKVFQNILFKFEQLQPKRVWTIEHKLNAEPAITVFDVSSKLALPKTGYVVTYVDSDTVKITHSTPVAGYADLVARTSSPRQPVATLRQADLFQTSVASSITLAFPRLLTRIEGASYNLNNPTLPAPSATVNSVPLDICENKQNIRIEIEVTQPNQSPIRCLETLDTVFAGSSPWFGWNKIAIKKRQGMCVATKDISKFKVFENINGDLSRVPNGTTLRFTRIDYGDGRINDIENRGLLMLLATPPYENVDKKRDGFIDLGDIKNQEELVFYFFNSEIFIAPKAIEKTYPQIEKLEVFRVPLPSPTPSPTPSISITPSASQTPTPSATQTPVPSASQTPLASSTPTPTPTVTASATPTPTPTPTPSSIILGCDVNSPSQRTVDDTILTARITEDGECRTTETV